MRARIEKLVPKVEFITSSENQEHPWLSKPSVKVEITWDKFSGEHSEWLAFYANFSDAVKNNTQIDEKKKFEALIDSLEGEAQALVNQAKTFDEAWEMLRISYGNAFRQAHATLKALMNIKAMEKRSIDEITSLVKQVDVRVEVFKATLIKQESEAMIPLLIVDKLDKITTQKWYSHYVSLARSWAQSSEAREVNGIKAIKFIPIWMHMRDFLIAEKGNLKREIDIRGQGHQKEFCSKCGAFHRLYKCPEFRKMSLNPRWNHVIKHELCERCLHPSHLEACKDARNNEPCEACKPAIKYHNSTLCAKRVK